MSYGATWRLHCKIKASAGKKRLNPEYRFVDKDSDLKKKK
jgi:hypothetical protein